MATGGKPDHTDALRIYAKFFCAMAHQTERTLDILQRPILLLRHPILEQHAGDADGVQPLADLSAFQLQARM